MWTLLSKMLCKQNECVLYITQIKWFTVNRFEQLQESSFFKVTHVYIFYMNLTSFNKQKYLVELLLISS